MRCFYILFLLAALPFLSTAQTITVSGACISGSPTLNRLASDVNGRPAYQGTGTVASFPNVVISIYWMAAPENLWVLDFDGQPFFQSACNRFQPPSTTNSSCPWSAVSGNSCTGGSALSITGTGTLPIRLTSFTAVKVENAVRLDWITASETDNKGFEIQRSADGADWKMIGYVNGAGTSATEKSYQFTDARPLKGKNYYRLVQYDLNGRSSTSAIVNIDFSSKETYTLQYTGNGIYQLQVRSAEPMEMAVFDQSGKRLLSRKLNPGVHQLDMTSYAAGIYLLQLQAAGQTITEKLIKP